jgi:hypothetical protein
LRRRIELEIWRGVGQVVPPHWTETLKVVGMLDVALLLPYGWLASDRREWSLERDLLTHGTLVDATVLKADSSTEPGTLRRQAHDPVFCVTWPSAELGEQEVKPGQELGVVYDPTRSERALRLPARFWRVAA